MHSITVMRVLVAAVLLIGVSCVSATDTPQQQAPLEFNAATGNLEVSPNSEVQQPDGSVIKARLSHRRPMVQQATGTRFMFAPAVPVVEDNSLPSVAPTTQTHDEVELSEVPSARCIFCDNGDCPKCYQKDPSGVCRQIFGCNT